MDLPSQPLIAVDVVPVSFGSDGLRLATARRRFEPFAGEHALPGVLLGAAESLVDAARRALVTKAGIDSGAVRHLFQIGAFDGTNRDPRQHAISIVFVALVDPAARLPGARGARDATPGAPEARPSDPGEWTDGPETTWWPAVAVRHLPFDHDAIVAEALAQLRTRLWRDDVVTRALTGPWFSTPDAVRLTDEVTGTPTHQSNLRRSLAAHPLLHSTTAPDTGRPGRRPLVWEWADE